MKGSLRAVTTFSQCHCNQLPREIHPLLSIFQPGSPLHLGLHRRVRRSYQAVCIFLNIVRLGFEWVRLTKALPSTWRIGKGSTEPAKLPGTVFSCHYWRVSLVSSYYRSFDFQVTGSQFLRESVVPSRLIVMASDSSQDLGLL